MISQHTQQSVAASELMSSGSLEFIGKRDGVDLYHHQQPANSATGVGPVGSCWAAEKSDEAVLPRAAS